MRLKIAGGVREHGRNSFLLQGESHTMLLDAGIMADEVNGYPRLLREEVQNTELLFLSHSHKDHTGAIPWLCQQGFSGTVIASEATLSRLDLKGMHCLSLEEIGPGGAGSIDDISFRWGRSGHCQGAVWLLLGFEGKKILYTGDYYENSIAYACDPIRGESCDLAVIDAAYGSREPYSRTVLLADVQKAWLEHGLVFFPVPKNGRGIDLALLFAEAFPKIPLYGDREFQENRLEPFWGRNAGEIAVRPYSSEISQGIVFLSDPQLRHSAGRVMADDLISKGAAGIMTGTPEPGGYSAELLQKGKMHFSGYPVHQTLKEANAMADANRFRQCLFFHSPEIGNRCSSIRL